MSRPDRIAVFGQRLEPRLDGVVEWTRGESGELELGADQARFKDWVIPYAAIKDAVLNTERMLHKKVQCLVIDAETGRFMFYPQVPIDVGGLPFPVRVTERRSAVAGRMHKLMGAWLAIVAISLISQAIKWAFFRD